VAMVDRSRAPLERAVAMVHRNVHGIELAASPEDVFLHLVMPDRRRDWNRSVADFQQLTGGEVAPGTRFREVVDDHGVRSEAVVEVLRCQPGRLLEERVTADARACTRTFTLQQRPGGTRLELRTQTEYNSPVSRLFGRLVTRQAQQQVESDLAGLRAQLDGGSQPARS
jgi:uncharacterized protein YndB with AHSA1/START domain